MRDGFDTLLNDNREFLLRYAYKLMCGNRDDGLDLFQIASLRAYRSFDRLQDEGKFAKWFCRILRNESLRFYRKERRAPRSLDDLLSDPETGEVTGDLIDSKVNIEAFVLERLDFTGKYQRVMAALARITPVNRQAFILFHVCGRTSLDIAAMTGTTDGNARKRVFRAVAAIRQQVMVPGAE